ncbi:uncharacterized protein LOC120120374 [Hibiscus syriacus]|uniref:uncharacterized protein LOC120120374 n=1 Tax=Hibiscus syriacus TaxID=106335 RepID=UPI00192354C0|nr:uncharacterized protein LOC120120374 [Hibiscus syriacus]
MWMELDTRVSTAGVVARNHYGLVIGDYARRLEAFQSANLVEARAFFEGITLVVENGWDEVMGCVQVQLWLPNKEHQFRPFDLISLSLKPLLWHRFQAKVLFKTHNSLYKHFRPSSSFIIRTLNSSPHEPAKKPLSLLFEEAVGLTEKTGGNEGQGQDEENELMSKLRELEREVREFKENPKPKVKKEHTEGVERGKPKKVNSVTGLFGGEKVEKMAKLRRKSGEVTVLKDLSVFVKFFVRHLYSKGYFDKANFLVDNKLNFGCFDNSYGRDFIKFAANKFGKDNEEIAKLLSGNHLKKVAVFGCPSLDKITSLLLRGCAKSLEFKKTLFAIDAC